MSPMIRVVRLANTKRPDLPRPIYRSRLQGKAKPVWQCPRYSSPLSGFHGTGHIPGNARGHPVFSIQSKLLEYMPHRCKGTSPRRKLGEIEIGLEDNELMALLCQPLAEHHPLPGEVVPAVVEYALEGFTHPVKKKRDPEVLEANLLSTAQRHSEHRKETLHAHILGKKCDEGLGTGQGICKIFQFLYTQVEKSVLFKKLSPPGS